MGSLPCSLSATDMTRLPAGFCLAPIQQPADPLHRFPSDGDGNAALVVYPAATNSKHTVGLITETRTQYIGTVSDLLKVTAQPHDPTPIDPNVYVARVRGREKKQEQSINIHFNPKPAERSYYWQVPCGKLRKLLRNFPHPK